ncbi:MAG: methyltransferase domain-containing protein [Solirubrobacterales bacterium]
MSDTRREETARLRRTRRQGITKASASYRQDLAEIHDDGFGFIARGAATLLLRELAAAGHRAGMIAELACGGGISARIFADAGFDVVGYDISAPMIEIARRRVPEASFETVSIYDAELPECVAVTAIGEAFNYRFDPRAGRASLDAMFVRAFDALRPGGMLIFDVAQPGRALPRLEHHVFAGAGWRVTSEVVEDPAARRLERRITSVREVDGVPRESSELHELELYDPEEIFERLRGAGFRPRQLAAYSPDYYFGLGHGGYLAVKPA